jgi:ferredoxin
LTEEVTAVKVSVDSIRCQGHGRCYDLVPTLFGEDAEGYAVVLGDGLIAPEELGSARRAALNCPESAVTLAEEEQ